nr:hypothetical protein [Tanacetum cinerariifolium]
FGVDAAEKIKGNTKCVSAAGEELTTAKHKLILWSSAVEVLMLLEGSYYCLKEVNAVRLELMLFRDAAVAAHMK